MGHSTGAMQRRSLKLEVKNESADTKSCLDSA